VFIFADRRDNENIFREDIMANGAELKEIEEIGITEMGKGGSWYILLPIFLRKTIGISKESRVKFLYSGSGKEVVIRFENAPTPAPEQSKNVANRQ
jgi:hypothetical protein